MSLLSGARPWNPKPLFLSAPDARRQPPAREISWQSLELLPRNGPARSVVLLQGHLCTRQEVCRREPGRRIRHGNHHTLAGAGKPGNRDCGHSFVPAGLRQARQGVVEDTAEEFLRDRAPVRAGRRKEAGLLGAIHPGEGSVPRLPEGRHVPICLRKRLRHHRARSPRHLSGRARHAPAEGRRSSQPSGGAPSRTPRT